MKFQDGVNKIRVLSQLVSGWEYWLEEDGKRKPIRVKGFEQVPLEHRSTKDKRDAAKFFWAFLVWNYQTESAQILEITQSTVRAAITTLTEDADWGDVYEYDLVITKSGKELETEYQINPKPKAKFDLKDKTLPTVNLSALFTGEDPFNSTSDKELEDISEALESSLDLADQEKP
jgi:hypothetical protein